MSSTVADRTVADTVVRVAITGREHRAPLDCRWNIPDGRFRMVVIAYPRLTPFHPTLQCRSRAKFIEYTNWAGCADDRSR